MTQWIAKTLDALGFDENKRYYIMAGLVALGVMLAAWIIGAHFRYIGNHDQVVTVKGVSEKQVSADQAAWTIIITAKNATGDGALVDLRAEREKLLSFLKANGFAAQDIGSEPESLGEWTTESVDKEGNKHETHLGKSASQKIIVTTADVAKMQKANANAADYSVLPGRGENIGYEIKDPNYTIKDLESLKLSMLSAAAANAKSRAVEFAKGGDVGLGAMKSASQGVINVTADNDDEEDGDNAGGSYSKKTIKKKVRVVVTVEYNLNA